MPELQPKSAARSADLPCLRFLVGDVLAFELPGKRPAGGAPMDDGRRRAGTAESVILRELAQFPHQRQNTGAHEFGMQGQVNPDLAAVSGQFEIPVVLQETSQSLPAQALPLRDLGERETTAARGAASNGAKARS